MKEYLKDYLPLTLVQGPYEYSLKLIEKLQSQLKLNNEKA